MSARLIQFDERRIEAERRAQLERERRAARAPEVEWRGGFVPLALTPWRRPDPSRPAL